MRRKALAALIPLGIAAVPAISLAGCGTRSANPGQSSRSSSGAGGAKPLTVSPSAGGPRTTFSLRFVAPASSGVTGKSRLGYNLSLTGPRQAGCIAARSIQVVAATKDVALPITLDPAQLGGSWCTGTYTVAMVEVVSPVCAVGTACPQFVRVVGTVATARFRVTSSG